MVTTSSKSQLCPPVPFWFKGNCIWCHPEPTAGFKSPNSNAYYIFDSDAGVKFLVVSYSYWKQINNIFNRGTWLWRLVQLYKVVEKFWIVGGEKEQD